LFLNRKCLVHSKQRGVRIQGVFIQALKAADAPTASLSSFGLAELFCYTGDANFKKATKHLNDLEV
jgi:hypothetical protein